MACFALFQVGCTSELEIDPLQSVDATVALETASDIDAALVGAYGIMHQGELYGTNFNLLAELQASDGYCQWRGTFQGQRQVSLKNMTSDNAEAARTWIQAYNAINIANNVLANSNKIADQDVRLSAEAEAKFIRGILHFELVRYYGQPYDPTGANDGLGVPLATVGVDSESKASVKGPRATIAQIYQQVISDLSEAEAGLPESRSGVSKFRGTTYTAKAFLARVYLQQGNYQAALEKANEVIESGNYALNPSIASTFTNKFTNETIFELYNNDQNNAGVANDGLTTFYASLVGIGRSDVRILPAFAANYEAEDERLSQLIYEGVGRRPGALQTGKWTSFGQNIPVIRLSELLLTRAECNLRLGTAVGREPLADVNEVRARSRASLKTSVAVEDVLLERQLELCFEGLRIHDIKRVKGSTGEFQWNDEKLVFPIPLREINANSALEQNPGYF